MPPLADPTDYGNAPGQGPLRVGGVPAPSTTTDKDLPSTRSELSKVQMPAVEMERDLWGGDQTVKGAKQTYLPQSPGEEPDSYNNRLNLSVFFNFFRRAIEGMVGLIFSKDPELGEEVPEIIREHWENIDLEGTHGDVFLWDLEIDAMTAGHAAIFVEFPDTEGMQGNEEEEAQEVRPYWIPIRKEDIMSWRTEVIGGVRTLTQIVLRERNWMPKGMYGEVLEEQYRVLRRSPEGIIGWEVVKVGKDNEIIIVGMGTYPTQTEIPISEIQTSGSESMFVSSPPLIDFSYLNVAHYQQWSGYVWATHKSNVPFLFGAGITTKKADGTDAGPLVVGANTALLDGNKDAKLGYVSHDGAALGSTKILLDDLKSDMGTLALAMLAPQKRSAETAEAKRLDKSTADSALSVSARALQDGVENALRFHANYLKKPSQPEIDRKDLSIKINRDFEGMLMDASVMGALAALVKEGFPVGEALKILQQGGRVSEDADLETLETLWQFGQAMNAQTGPEAG